MAGWRRNLDSEQSLCHIMYRCVIIVTAPTQPQHNLNLTQRVGMDMKMALHTTHPTHHETQHPSQGASDQPLMLAKQQNQH